MPPGLLDVAQPTFQIAQTLQRVGFAQPSLLGFIQRQGGVVMPPGLLDVAQPTFQIAQTLKRVGFAQPSLLGFIQRQGGVVMPPGLLDVAQPTFQIAQTLKRVGFAQPSLLGFIQRQGGVVMPPGLLDVAQPTFQIAQTLKRVGFARSIPGSVGGFDAHAQPFASLRRAPANEHDLADDVGQPRGASRAVLLAPGKSVLDLLEFSFHPVSGAGDRGPRQLKIIVGVALRQGQPLVFVLQAEGVGAQDGVLLPAVRRRPLGLARGLDQPQPIQQEQELARRFALHPPHRRRRRRVEVRLLGEDAQAPQPGLARGAMGPFAQIVVAIPQRDLHLVEAFAFVQPREIAEAPARRQALQDLPHGVGVRLHPASGQHCAGGQGQGLGVASQAGGQAVGQAGVQPAHLAQQQRAGVLHAQHIQRLDGVFPFLQAEGYVVVAGGEQQRAFVGQRRLERRQRLVAPHIVRHHQQRAVAGKEPGHHFGGQLAVLQQFDALRRVFIGEGRHPLQMRRHVKGAARSRADVQPEDAAGVEAGVAFDVHIGQDALADAGLAAQRRRGALADQGDAAAARQPPVQVRQLLLASHCAADAPVPPFARGPPMQAQLAHVVDVENGVVLADDAVDGGDNMIFAAAFGAFGLSLPLLGGGLPGLGLAFFGGRGAAQRPAHAGVPRLLPQRQPGGQALLDGGVALLTGGALELFQHRAGVYRQQQVAALGQDLGGVGVLGLDEGDHGLQQRAFRHLLSSFRHPCRRRQFLMQAGVGWSDALPPAGGQELGVQFDLTVAGVDHAQQGQRRLAGVGQQFAGVRGHEGLRRLPVRLLHPFDQTVGQGLAAVVAQGRQLLARFLLCLSPAPQIVQALASGIGVFARARGQFVGRGLLQFIQRLVGRPAHQTHEVGRAARRLEHQQ